MAWEIPAMLATTRLGAQKPRQPRLARQRRTSLPSPALRLFEADFRPVVLTDSPEVIRRIRARAGQRTPYILYVAEIDDSAEREGGSV